MIHWEVVKWQKSKTLAVEGYLAFRFCTEEWRHHVAPEEEIKGLSFCVICSYAAPKQRIHHNLVEDSVHLSDDYFVPTPVTNNIDRREGYVGPPSRQKSLKRSLLSRRIVD